MKQQSEERQGDKIIPICLIKVSRSITPHATNRTKINLNVIFCVDIFLVFNGHREFSSSLS